MSGKSEEPNQPQLERLVKEIDPKTYDSIPRKERPKVPRLVQIAVSQASISQFSGPLPPPDALRAYNDILPGAAERIFQMAEKQSDHRQQLENRVATAQIGQSNRGQLYALIIAIAFLIGSVICAVTGHEAAASVLGGGTVVSLAGAFIAGRVQQRVNLAEKNPTAALPKR
jgi:uncharacterized membrane protein